VENGCRLTKIPGLWMSHRIPLLVDGAKLESLREDRRGTPLQIRDNGPAI